LTKNRHLVQVTPRVTRGFPRVVRGETSRSHRRPSSAWRGTVQFQHRPNRGTDNHADLGQGSFSRSGPAPVARFL